jgi:hypothetical protein
MQAFILHNGERLTDPALEPPDLKAVWFAGADSPLATHAKGLSQNGQPALAVLEYEGDSLKLWLFEKGVLSTEYDSSPSFATCTITPPVGENVERLALAFGVPHNAKAVQQLLGRKRGFGFINERDRLKQLLGLLGLEPQPNSV